jgi:hypothetical protein
MNETFSDCRTDDGVTIGLIDAIITMCRLLINRDLSTADVIEALKDIANDEDFNQLETILKNYQD